MDILNIVKNQLSGETADQLCKKLGIDPKMLSGAVDSALPLLLGALSKNSKSETGANALAGALDKDHDGGVFGKLSELISNPDSGAGNGILKHVLGDKRTGVEKVISKKSGIEEKNTGKIMEVLAPVVMGAIGKVKRQQNLDAAGVKGLLEKENKVLAKEKGEKTSFINSLLDKDGDGDVMDDVSGMIGGFFS